MVDDQEFVGVVRLNKASGQKILTVPAKKAINPGDNVFARKIKPGEEKE